MRHAGWMVDWSIGHRYDLPVREATLNISEFKARCLRLLDEVADQGIHLIITKRGRPIARVAPISVPSKSLRGSWKGIVKIKGGIVHFQEGSWESDQ